MTEFENNVKEILFGKTTGLNEKYLQELSKQIFDAAIKENARRAGKTITKRKSLSSAENGKKGGRPKNKK